MARIPSQTGFQDVLRRTGAEAGRGLVPQLSNVITPVVQYDAYVWSPQYNLHIEAAAAGVGFVNQVSFTNNQPWPVSNVRIRNTSSLERVGVMFTPSTVVPTTVLVEGTDYDVCSHGPGGPTSIGMGNSVALFPGAYTPCTIIPNAASSVDWFDLGDVGPQSTVWLFNMTANAVLEFDLYWIERRAPDTTRANPIIP